MKEATDDGGLLAATPRRQGTGTDADGLRRRDAGAGEAGQGRDADVAWRDLFREAAGRAGRLAGEDPGRLRHDDRALDPDDPVVFEEALLPFVRAGRRRLRRRRPAEGRADPAPSALADLERRLLVQLSEVADRALYARFAAWREREAGLLGACLGTSGSRGLYEDYVREELRRGWEGLSEAFPVLPRLLAARTALWLDATAEFLERYGDDRPRLAEHFCPGGSPGPLTGIRAGLSDPHAGGREVLVLRFADGCRVVYKPRGLGMHVAVGTLLDHLNEGLSLDLRVPRVLDRGSHGWAEHVRSRPTPRTAGTAFHRRGGMLLCLSYVFNAMDLHAGNLLRAGERPVPVDLECFMAPRPSPRLTGHGDADGRVFDALWDSVLRTGLLPARRPVVMGEVHSRGGLAASGVAGRRGRRSRWRDTNTDRMRPDPGGDPDGAGRDAADDGSAVGGHVEDVVSGYREMHALLVRRREEIQTRPWGLAAFEGRRSRVLLRSTRIYDRAAERACHPARLRSSSARRGELRRLLETAGEGGERSALWDALLQEQRELDAMDVPLFLARTDRRELTTSDGRPLLHYADRTAMRDVRDRLWHLDADDLDRQTAVIRHAYRARESVRVYVRDRADDPAAASEEAPDERLLREAVRLGDRLLSLSRARPGGGLTWIALRAPGPGETPTFVDIGDTLYEGTAGVGLFLAALHRVTGEERFREGAIAALPAGPTGLGGDAAGGPPGSGLGGGTGLGGWTYALARSAELLGSAGLLDAARAAGLGIGEARIRTDRRLDVMGGAAGAVLGLLALDDVCSDGWPVERARACGRRLLEARRPDPPSGLRAWRPGGEGFTAGFAHGQSGIAHALLALHRRTGEDELLTAAEEGMAVERGSVRPEGRGRPEGDRRPGSVAERAGAWCRGAPGIGLARAAHLELLGSEARDDLERAVRVLETAGTDGPDHLCCGSMGRIEMLLTAADALGRSGPRREAWSRLASVLETSEERKMYRVGVEDSLAPGLFQGIAGIGYQLARAAAPGRLPSILTWA